MKYVLGHADYPKALLALPNPPPVLTTSGPLERRRAVAIVGSREADKEAVAFAHDLAFRLASAGIVIVSGGAVGVDGAAHRGALDAGGTTWVVSPTGEKRVYPPEHKGLFAEIAASRDSRMIWPFPAEYEATRHNLIFRNGVLTALSETVVVVQAHLRSGSRNACTWARSLGRTVWAVPATPWTLSFSGSLDEIERGRARPLCSPRQLLRSLGLPIRAAKTPQLSLAIPPTRRATSAEQILETPSEPPPEEPWTDDETRVFSALSRRPRHVDKIVDRTGLQVPPVITALLTLSLKDVVVEGPDGFFRRRLAG